MMATVLDVNRPESASNLGGELAEPIQALVTKLADHSITDVASLEQAVLDRDEIGSRIKAVETYFAPLKQAAYRMHRLICDRESDFILPLRKLDERKRDAIRSFKTAQDQLRRQQEQEREAAERVHREAVAAAEAAALENAGDGDMAAAVLQEAIESAPPVVALPDITKQVDGLKFVKRYLWRYAGNKDKASRIIPREFLLVDEKKIGAYARSMKGTGSIPGIEFYSVDDPVR